MINPIFEDLHTQGLISDESLEKIRRKHSSGLFSVHWELKVLLYLGVMMLSTGLGIWVYKNIDTISHQVVLIAIGLITVICFTWCYKNKEPFSPEKVESPNSLFDYVLLLGSLSFLSFVGYLQFQYDVFGTRYGLATFVPMLVLFLTAYYFDHLGILAMAIANLAIWLGVSVTPKALLESGDFNNETAIYTYLNLGLFLFALGIASKRYHFKKHFSFTYEHFGLHLTFISLISGYFHFTYYPALVWLFAFVAAAWFIFTRAFSQKSFYFVLLTVLYSYALLTGFVYRTLGLIDQSAGLYIGILYTIVSGICLVLVLISLNKQLKAI